MFLGFRPPDWGNIISLSSRSAGSDGVLLIQLAKAPIPGNVKTRMRPALSAQQACDLHIELMQWTTRTLCSAGVGDVELWITGGDKTHRAFQQCQAYGLTAIHFQQGQDLGQRMYYAIRDGLSRYGKVVLVGSDCPSIDRDYLSDAVATLEHRSLVLGPATDGGYVLIGASSIHPGIFQGVSWGEATVFEQTLERAKTLGKNYGVLSALADIDRPEDLPGWKA